MHDKAYPARTVTTKAWRPLMVTALVTAAGVLTFAIVLLPHEPRYRGKVLSIWLEQIDPSLGGSGRDEAAQAVRAIGTNALPKLTTMLRAKDSLWTKSMIKFNNAQTLVRIPVTTASTFGARALAAYAVLGGAAEPNVPVLVSMLQSDQSPSTRANVALALAQIGRAARAAVPALSKAAADKDPQISQNARVALMNIQGYDPVGRSF